MKTATPRILFLLLPLALFGTAAQALRIEGLVLGETGAPVVGASVRLVALSPAAVPSKSESDDRGCFRLEAAVPGLYRVTVEAEGRGALETGPLAIVEALVLPPARMPGPVDGAGAAPSPAPPWTLPPRGGRPAPGLARERDRTPGREVIGRVRDAASGTPVGGALIWPLGREDLAVSSDQAGGFRLTVPGGTELPLATIAPGRPLSTQPLGADQPRVVIDLARGEAVEGSVVDGTERPIAGATLALGGAAGVPRDPRSLTASDRRGRFRLCCAVPGPDLVVVASKRRYTTGRVTIPPAASGSVRTPVRIVLAAGRTVTGRVVGPDGEPLERARVQLRPTGERPDPAAAEQREVTGPDGAFRLPGVPYGRYALVAEAEGWAPTRIPGVRIPPGADLFDLGSVLLEPGSRIEGEVVDADGVPIPDARVRARPSEARGDDPSRETEALTGPDGRFVVAGLAPGERLDLEAVADRHAPVRVERVDVPPPNALRIVLPAGGSVAGVVVDEAGDPVPGAAVHLATTEEAARTMTVTGTDESGRFRSAGVAPGTVEIEVTTVAHRPARKTIELPPDSDREDLRIVLRRGGVLDGVVLTPTGEPVAGARVAAAPIRSGAAGLHAVSTDAAGRFRLEGLEPGRWALAADAEGFRRASRRVEVPTEEAAGALEIRLGRGAEVAGRILDATGRGVPGAIVRLDRLDGAAGGLRRFLPASPAPQGASRADGSFRIQGVGDGVYRLHASHPGQAETELPEPVRVEGAGVRGIVLYLETGTVLSGRLLGIAPAELGRLRVVALSSASGSAVEGTVRRDGSYRVDGLATGTWVIAASVPETGALATATVTLTDPGESARLDLAFRTGDRVDRVSGSLDRRESAPSPKRPQGHR